MTRPQDSRRCKAEERKMNTQLLPDIHASVLEVLTSEIEGTYPVTSCSRDPNVLALDFGKLRRYPINIVVHPMVSKSTSTHACFCWVDFCGMVIPCAIVIKP